MSADGRVLELHELGGSDPATFAKGLAPEATIANLRVLAARPCDEKMSYA